MTDKELADQRISCYSRLEPKLAQFRTLTILPGLQSETINCQLSVHTLDHAPRYETISYAWGDPEDTKRITVDGVELAIPSSLELCLKHLRNAEHASVNLWADAICIDQTNLEERSDQVSHMGVIYWKCKSMFIWLGISSEASESENPFELVLHWAADKHFHDYPGFSFSEQSGKWTFHDNPAYQQMFKLFTDFILKSWWTRLWCVQEIALCPAATMILGKWRISWGTMKAALDNYRYHAWNCCAASVGTMPAKYTYFIDHLLFLQNQSDLTDMDLVFRNFRHKLSKDPRDRIYGLLGLLWDNDNTNLRPDYSLSVGQVYLKATESIVSQSEGDLKFLTGSGLNSECYLLPSWVRNFAAPLSTVEASYEGFRYARYCLYDASAGTRADVRVLNDRILNLTGAFIDHIEIMGNSVTNRNWPHLWQIMQEWAGIAGLPNLDPRYSDNLLQARFWRTIMADIFYATSGDNRWRRIPASTETPVETWCASTVDCLRRGLEPIISFAVNALLGATYGRAFFRTKAGRFGLCYPDARPGDELWALAGGRVPFVLRHIGETHESAEQVTTGTSSFMLLGECYIHGFMDGEAFHAHNFEQSRILLK